MKIAKYIILIFCVLLMSQNFSAQGMVEVPFELDNGQIIVSTNYKKKTPLRMIVSNFYASSIDVDVPHVKKTILMEYSYPVGTTNKFTPVSLVSDLTIGGVTIPTIKMYWNDSFESQMKPFQQYQGVLGNSFFDNQVIQIDYPKNVLRFYKGNSSKDLFKNISQDGSKSIIKFKTSTTDAPFEKIYATTEEILVDDKKAKILLSVNELSQDRNVENKKIKIGGIELNDVPLIKGDSKKYDYILGVDFMKNFVITFNYKTNQFMIEKKS